MNKVLEVEQELVSFMKEQKSEIRDTMVQTGALSDELVADLKAALSEFVKTLEGRFTTD